MTMVMYPYLCFNTCIFDFKCIVTIMLTALFYFSIIILTSLFSTAVSIDFKSCNMDSCEGDLCDEKTAEDVAAFSGVSARAVPLCAALIATLVVAWVS